MCSLLRDLKLLCVSESLNQGCFSVDFLELQSDVDDETEDL